jgi:hypothetical protein
MPLSSKCPGSFPLVPHTIVAVKFARETRVLGREVQNCCVAVAVQVAMEGSVGVLSAQTTGFPR